jgi:hypothetical protein
VKKTSPHDQLEAFLSRYSPEIRALATAALKKMRSRLPGAFELVYDNYNALVVGFGATDRASDAVFSIALYPRWVNLFFLQGAKLGDPETLLKGSGKQVRHIVLEDPSVLDRPAVRALMKEALQSSPKPIRRSSGGTLVIKSISAKKRPRRPREPIRSRRTGREA